MKITVNQLRKIIKEEVQRSLNEGPRRPRTTLTADTPVDTPVKLTADTPVEYALGILVGQGKITATNAYRLFESFAKYASEGDLTDFDVAKESTTLDMLVGQGKITADEAYILFEIFAKYASGGGSWDFDYIRSALAEYSRETDTGEGGIYKSAHKAFSKMGNEPRRRPPGRRGGKSAHKAFSKMGNRF